MAFPNLNNRGGPHGDGGIHDAPQSSRPQYNQSNTSPDDRIISMDGWHVTRAEPLSFAGTMSLLLQSQGYTVIPPGGASSSRQRQDLISALRSEGGLDFLRRLHPSHLSSALGSEGHRTQVRLQSHMTRLSQAQAAAVEARNRAAEARSNAAEAMDRATEARSNAAEARTNPAGARNNVLRGEGHRTQTRLQADMARLSRTQADAAEARNRAAEAMDRVAEARSNAAGARNNAAEARNRPAEARNNATEARHRPAEAMDRAVGARSNAAEARNNAAGVRNGDASKNNKKPKKKKLEKNKKQSQEEKVCPHFQESGKCRYGDNCKFSHIIPDTLPSPDDKANPDPDPPKKEQDSSTKEKDYPKKEQESPKKEKDSPIDLFFGKHPEFDYMRDKPLWDEFDRMNQHFQLKGTKHQTRAEFHIALVKEFNHMFGVDEGSLESWGKLCAAMGLSTPTTLEEAHKIVRDAYVNLVVLVQSSRTGEPVKVFKSAEDLKEFTAETKWIFPQRHAQAGGLLKMLLRKMGGPSHGRRPQGKKKAVAK